MLISEVLIDIGAVFSAAIARITVAGPVTQSPPAKIPFASSISEISNALILPCSILIPEYSANFRKSMPARSQARPDPPRCSPPEPLNR